MIIRQNNSSTLFKLLGHQVRIQHIERKERPHQAGRYYNILHGSLAFFIVKYFLSYFQHILKLDRQRQLLRRA